MKNCIKKSLTILSIFAAMLMAGCASDPQKGEYQQWKEERAFSEKISSVYKLQKPLTLDDVAYKSEIKSPGLAAPVNTLSAGIATIYLTVVNGADKSARVQSGKSLKLRGGELNEAQKKLVKEYEEFVRRGDQEKIIKTVIIPLAAKLAKEGEKVAQLVNQLKNNPEFRALAGLEALKAGKAIAADADALSSQIADAAQGIKLWRANLESINNQEANGQDEKIDN